MRWKLIICLDGLVRLRLDGETIATSEDANLLLAYYGEVSGGALRVVSQ